MASELKVPTFVWREKNGGFTINWNAVINASNYELQEATAPNFNNATTQVISDTTTTISHTVTTQPQRYYYRVRAVSNCSDDRSNYSKIVSVVIVPQTTKTTNWISAVSRHQQDGKQC